MLILTGDVDDGRLTLDLTPGVPGDTLAPEAVRAEVLFHVVTGDVHHQLHVPDTSLGIDELLVRVQISRHLLQTFTVALEVDLRTRRYSLARLQNLHELTNDRVQVIYVS